jgi:hypothetical protein
MDDESYYSGLPQLTLFDLGDTVTEAVELFPAVWRAAEALTMPEPGTRLYALERLNKLNAPRISPLVAYLVATRIDDPDIEMRIEAIRTLGLVLVQDEEGKLATDTVRYHLSSYLSQMRTRQVYSLLQAIVHQPDILDHVARLLDDCPYGGNHLVEILSSRKVQLAIRQEAVRLIGIVGYLDAIPALERMLIRLESRIQGQQAMSFIPLTGVDDSALLPEIQIALKKLNTL